MRRSRLNWREEPKVVDWSNSYAQMDGDGAHSAGPRTDSLVGTPTLAQKVEGHPVDYL